MTLDEAIEHEKLLNIMAEATEYQPRIKKTRRMIDWLTELRDRRESELRPATWYLSNTPERQLLHVHSEIYEIIDAIDKLKHHKTDEDWQRLLCNLADEIYDAQSSLTTLAYICGLNRDDMMAAGKRKVKVNAERGYYEDDRVNSDGD